MNFLEALRAAPSAPQAKLNTFLAVFSPDGKTVAIFIEGRDDPSFFRIHVEAIARPLALSVEIIRMGNKAEVLSARTFVTSRYGNTPRALFFVDKDHDDFIPGSDGAVTEGNLFVTSVYAIENYCVSADAVRAVLIDLWGIDSSSPALTAALSAFDAALVHFYQNSLLWMAWLIAARRRGISVNSDNISLREICRFGEGLAVKVEWPTNFSEYLARVCKASAEPTELETNDVAAVLGSRHPKTWLRGKAELAFLVLFLDELRVVAGQQISVRTQFGVKNALEVLAPRLPCPPELAEFLNQQLKQVNKET